jgi:flagellar biosynthesis/type III secretory pathway chaperone
MAPSKLDWSELDQSLQRDTLLSQQLIDVLEQERLSLENRQYEQFQQLLQTKEQLLNALEQGATGRRQWLAQRGFADDKSALTLVTRQAPTIAELWQNAAEQWRACQHANKVNEQICGRTRVVVERVLDILRGQTSQGATYDAKGVAHSAQSGRTISNA